MASPPLYWKHQALGGTAVNITAALGAAKDVLQKSGLVQIKQGAADVSGRTPDSHAAIGFVKTGSTYVAVIMAAGTGAKDIVLKLSKALDALSWV